MSLYWLSFMQAVLVMMMTYCGSDILFRKVWYLHTVMIITCYGQLNQQAALIGVMCPTVIANFVAAGKTPILTIMYSQF